MPGVVSGTGQGLGREDDGHRDGHVDVRLVELGRRRAAAVARNIGSGPGAPPSSMLLMPMMRSDAARASCSALVRACVTASLVAWPRAVPVFERPKLTPLMEVAPAARQASLTLPVLPMLRTTTAKLRDTL